MAPWSLEGRAQDPTIDSVGVSVQDRPVQVTVGPGASVTKLQRVKGDIVELVVKDTPVELDAVLNMRNTPSIRNMDAMSSGGRVWFVRVGLRDAQSDLEARVEDGVLTLEVVPRTSRDSPVRGRVATVEELVNGPLPSAPPRPEVLELTSLPGDAVSLAMEPWSYAVTLLPSPGWLPRSTWDAVDRARTAMLGATSSAAETQARYRLGLHYLELGFGKEARYYFNEISKRPGPVSQRDLEVARARAALSCGRWDEARQHLIEAWRLGAPEAGVLEGMAVVSLATSNPPRAATGRALAAATARPESRMLAAELLQRDGYVSETRPILEGLGPQLSSEDAERVALRLGDALLMDGDVPAAVRAWGQTRPDLAVMRERLVELLRGDPSQWAAAIPGLVQSSIPRTDAGAESLYLLAQIDLAVPIATREDAINELAAIMRRYPRKAEGSDVPERFWRVYSGYVGELAKAGRWFDIAAMHEAVWDRTVRRAITDSRVLVDVARAYEEVGLPERAMVVLRDAVEVLNAKGQDDAGLVFQLARLYAKTQRHDAGLKSIAYMEAMGIPPELRGPAALTEAELHAGTGDLAAAADALRRAGLIPEYRDEASLRLAMMDAEAGRCARAAPSLQRLLFTPKGEETYTAAEPWVALARCLRVAGDREGAARAAKGAAARSSSDGESRYATWLAAAASDWRDEESVATLVEGDDIWALMAKEQQASEAFELELQARRETEWSARR